MLATDMFFAVSDWGFIALEARKKKKHIRVQRTAGSTFADRSIGLTHSILFKPCKPHASSHLDCEGNYKHSTELQSLMFTVKATES